MVATLFYKFEIDREVTIRGNGYALFFHPENRVPCHQLVVAWRDLADLEIP